MEAEIYCLVDATGMAHVTDGATSYAEVAAGCGVDERACRKYRFDLTNRELLSDDGDAAGDRAARICLDRWVGTPDRLMAFAKAGRLPKQVLAHLLTINFRPAYLDACAAIERRYTEDCAAAKDPCLESGCAVEGEICLQPLLRSEVEYRKACAAEWVKRFASPRNRIAAWKN